MAHTPSVCFSSEVNDFDLWWIPPVPAMWFGDTQKIKIRICVPNNHTHFHAKPKDSKTSDKLCWTCWTWKLKSPNWGLFLLNYTPLGFLPTVRFFKVPNNLWYHCNNTINTVSVNLQLRFTLHFIYTVTCLHSLGIFFSIIVYICTFIQLNICLKCCFSCHAAQHEFNWIECKLTDGQ